MDYPAKLIKEQLLPEFDFIGYCDRDDANKYTSGKKPVNSSFIRAAKNEGLLLPLYSAEGDIRQLDGSIKKEIIDYYSPLQLYIITELRLNIVQDGALWEPGSIDWYPERPKNERPRYVAWGSSLAFLARKIGDPARKKTDDVLFNPYMFVAIFDSFLRFIHTTPVKDRYAIPVEDTDMFAYAPIFDHDFSGIASLPDALKKYKLDAKKLEILRSHIGRTAAVIDPLELWYYYIERHPAPKKSLLKGDAQVAQKLYRLSGLITEIWEKTTGKTPPPFLEFIAGEHGGYLTPRVEYLKGADVRAMRQSIGEFQNWARIRGNNKFVTAQIKQALAKATAELDEYEKRYGDRSYGGSYRIRKDEGVRYDQLDDALKQRFDQMHAQNRDEEDWSLIASLIDLRLGDIQRSLSAVYRGVSAQLHAITSEAWDTQKHLNSQFWMQHGNLSQQERQTLFQKETKRLFNHARKCQEKEREFWRAVSAIGRAFCKVCRERPVQLHTDSDRGGFQAQPSICDKCVREKKEFPDNTKDAEWRCDYCDTLIYKFVHGNVLSARTESHASVVSELQYGLMEVKATCPNRECKKELYRTIEWGWLP